MKCTKDNHLRYVKTLKKNIWVLPIRSVKILCHYNGIVNVLTTNVIFAPDKTEPWPHGLKLYQELFTVSKGASHRVYATINNNTNHQMLLKARTVLDGLDPIKSIIPGEAKLGSTTVTNSTQKTATFQQEIIKISETNSNNASDFVKKCELTDLDEQQRRMVEDMLMSHAESLSSSEQDIGCLEGFCPLVYLTQHQVKKPEQQYESHYMPK